MSICHRVAALLDLSKITISYSVAALLGVCTNYSNNYQ
jgi:hypothetical protein